MAYEEFMYAKPSAFRVSVPAGEYFVGTGEPFPTWSHIHAVAEYDMTIAVDLAGHITVFRSLGAAGHR